MWEVRKLILALIYSIKIVIILLGERQEHGLQSLGEKA